MHTSTAVLNYRVLSLSVRGPHVPLLALNSEAAVDRISLEHHALAKRAKDIGSAAVMLALVNVPVVWGLILFA